MKDKDRKEIEQIIQRFEEGYTPEKYGGFKHHAEHTKEWDFYLLVEYAKKMIE